MIYMAMKTKLKNEEREIEFNDLNFLDKILFIIDQPFDYARKVTLPPCEPEKYEKMWAVIFPAPGFLFIVFAIFLRPEFWWLYVGAVGLVFSAIIFFTSPENEPPYYLIIFIFLDPIMYY